MRLLAKLALSGAAVATLAIGALAQETPVQPPEQPAPVQPAPVPTAPVIEQPAEPTARLQAASGAKLRALDKITGNSTDITAKVGQTVAHGRIKVTVRACYQSSPQDAPEAAAFLEIHAVPKDGKAPPKQQGSNTQMHRGAEPIGPDGLLYSGWMYASSPGLNGLEHPTYDVWVISCTTSSPQ